MPDAVLVAQGMNREVEVGKYRFETMVEWSQGNESYRTGDVPIDFFSPYQSWVRDQPTRSDYCTNVSQLAHLELLILRNQVFTVVGPELPGIYHLLLPRSKWKMEVMFLSTYEETRHISTISCYRPRQSVHLFSPKGKLTMKMKFNAPSAPSAP